MIAFSSVKLYFHSVFHTDFHSHIFLCLNVFIENYIIFLCSKKASSKNIYIEISFEHQLQVSKISSGINYVTIIITNNCSGQYYKSL